MRNLYVETLFAVTLRISTNITSRYCICWAFFSTSGVPQRDVASSVSAFWETCVVQPANSENKQQHEKAGITESMIHQSPFLSWLGFLFWHLGKVFEVCLIPWRAGEQPNGDRVLKTVLCLQVFSEQSPVTPTRGETSAFSTKLELSA